jgi:cell division protein FtsB
MTRKIGLLFVVMSIIILILLEGLLGSHGYFVNRALNKSIAERKYVRDEIALEVEYLQKRLETVGEIDELRDSALRLGYVVPGEKVYHFPDGSGSVEDENNQDLMVEEDVVFGSTKERFNGISFPVLFVFSLIISTIFCLGWGFFTFRKKRSIGDDDATDN